MEPSSHPDPIGESVSHSTQRAAQLVSISMAAAQGYVIFRARHAAIRAAEDEQILRSLRDQERRDYQQARLGWAPALDKNWLSQADLVQAACTWGAAAPHAETETSAQNAMLASEGRLRVLHPFAMARYDRLRAEGLSPTDAMIETAPLFARHPFAHEGAPGTPRPALVAATPWDAEDWLSKTDHDDQLTARAERILADDLGNSTTGPLLVTGEGDIPGGTEVMIETMAADTPSARSASDRSTAKAAALAAQCFPVSISQALRAATPADGETGPTLLTTALRQRGARPRSHDVSSNRGGLKP